MTVSYKSINAFAIILALLAVALFPFWPYSRWGYTPSVLVAVIVVFLVMFRKLARD